MKKIKFLVAITFIAISFLGCSSDSSSSSSSQWAMTSKVNGTLWQMNNPFNTNNDSPPVFTYYPASDYIRLAGRNGGTFGLDEINLMIKRTDLTVGTHSIGLETFDGTNSQIDVAFNSFANIQDVAEGTINITEINTTAKTVKGTFEFKCVENFEPISATNPVTTTVTDGTFNYKYDTN